MFPNEIYDDCFEMNTITDLPLTGPDDELRGTQRRHRRPQPQPAPVIPIVDVDSITFEDIGDSDIGGGIISPGEGLGQLLQETAYKALSGNFYTHSPFRSTSSYLRPLTTLHTHTHTLITFSFLKALST